MAERRTSISGRLKLLFALLFPLAVLYTWVSIWGARSIREKSTQYTGALVDIYVNDIDEKIININRKLGLLYLGKGDVEQDVNAYIHAIRYAGNEAYKNYYISGLKNIFDTYAMEYGDGYHFFVYFQDQELYIGNQGDAISIGEFKKYEKGIGSFFKEHLLEKDSGSQYWKILPLSETGDCIIKFYRKQDYYIGCWVRPEELIRPLSAVAKAGGGAVLLYDREDKLYAGLSDGRHAYYQQEMHTQPVIEKEFGSMPFSIRLVMTNHGMFQTIFTAQVLMMVLSLGMLALVCGSVYYLYRKVLVPVKKFSRNLELIRQGGQEPEEITTGELEDLKKANQEFASLFKKINVLEDEINRQEIEKQNIYLDYLKLQIRPHFYLNCLNFIYNMIDLKKDELASRMVGVTADYMRYLLKNEQGFVYIWEEMEHIVNYMEIQKLRFEGAVDYCSDQDESTRNARIPHMLIQPFVENCVKYAADLSHKVVINITVYGEEVDGIPYVNICISDTGPGFSKELLACLNKDSVGEQNLFMGIGIMNTVKRLKHYYGNKCSITFSNGSSKGAIIDIHIPENLEMIGQQEGGIL